MRVRPAVTCTDCGARGLDPHNAGCRRIPPPGVRAFNPTHLIITRDERGAETYTVAMVVGMHAFTRLEWNGSAPADWELIAGIWRFRGQIPTWCASYEIRPIDQPEAA